MTVFRSNLSHYRNILASMNDLRKQKSPCDVRIKVGSQEIRAHRCVLMAASDFFSSVLSGIQVNTYIDISPTTRDVCAVESVINYLYSGEIRIDNDNLESIIKVASLFIRADIKNVCCKFMRDNLDWKTSTKYNQLALDYRFPILQQQIAQIIKSRFKPSLLSDGSFQNISPGDLKFLVSHCSIFENCGVKQVLQFLSDWVRSSKSKEHEEVGCDILKHITAKTDAKDMDLFSQVKFNESSFEEAYENVVLLLKCNFTQGAKYVVFRPSLTSVKEPGELLTVAASLQHTDNPEISSISPCQLDSNGREEQVTSDTVINEPAMCTDDLHQISIDIDGMAIETGDNIRGKSIVRSNKCLNELTENHIAFSCMVCHRKFNKLEQLNVHKKIHSKKATFECVVCKKKFSFKKYLDTHMSVHNTYKGTDTFSANNEKQDAHIRENVRDTTYSSDKSSQSVKLSATYKCASCDEQFTTQHLLKVHQKRHPKIDPYDCAICKRKFKRKYHLKNHLKLQHGYDPDICHKCSICQKQYRKKSDLTKHMLYHEGIKRHFCSVCNKGFIVKGALTNHMKTHNSERTLPCQICFKFFRDNTCLKEHMATHVDHEPYICEVCGSEYKINLLSEHTREPDTHKRRKHSNAMYVTNFLNKSVS